MFQIQINQPWGLPVGHDIRRRFRDTVFVGHTNPELVVTLGQQIGDVHAAANDTWRTTKCACLFSALAFSMSFLLLSILSLFFFLSTSYFMFFSLIYFLYFSDFIAAMTSWNIFIFCNVSPKLLIVFYSLYLIEAFTSLGLRTIYSYSLFNHTSPIYIHTINTV